MNDGLKLALMAVLVLAVALVAGSLGLTVSGEINTLPTQLPEPTGGIGDLIAPLSWALTALASLAELLTFQADIPPTIYLFISALIIIPVLIMFIRIVRGGG